MESTGDYLGIRLDGDGPLHQQLYRALRDAILEGHLEERSRLPATRRLARMLGVSRNTVLQAFEQLVAEGFLIGKTGAGTFVASPLSSSSLRVDAAAKRHRNGSPPPKWSAFGQRVLGLRQDAYAHVSRPRYDFRYGRIDADARLRKTWQRLVNRAAGRHSVDYGDPRGARPLRESLAIYLRTRGCACEADQILIVNGSQQALDLLARLLVDRDAHVAVEDPGYLGARNAFLATGVKLHGVPVDDEGLRVDRIPPPCRLVYVTPSHQFPTGAVLSLRRRAVLLEWAQANDGWIIEDDYDGEYRYEGRPIAAIQGLDRYGRTLYVGTFSKILFPAARLGYLVLPHSMVETFMAAKWWADRHTPTLEQLALAELIESGEFERHLRRMRKTYDERRSTLIDALARRLGNHVTVTGTRAGLHLVATIDKLQPTRLQHLIESAREREVGLYSAEPLYLEPPQVGSLLMGFATMTPEEIRAGIDRIVDLVVAHAH